jgi:hypothetical protein
MLNLEKTDLKDNVLIVQNEDGSIQCVPEEGATSYELALFEEFRQAYPDGKSEPVVEPQEPVLTDIEQLRADVDYIMIMQGL